MTHPLLDSLEAIKRKLDELDGRTVRITQQGSSSRDHDDFDRRVEEALIRRRLMRGG